MLQRRRTLVRRQIHLFASASVFVALAAGVIAPTHAVEVVSDEMPYFSDSDTYQKSVGATSAPSSQSLVSVNGGGVASAQSFPGAGSAARYPAFGGASTAPRAVVAMTNSSSIDVLTPLAKVFTFGAAINSDAVSTGTAYDNGNNIFQRGLFGDVAQYKIQIDHGYAMCRVKGDKGTISITSTHLMPTNQWFHVECTRKVLATGDKLVLAVTPISSDGTFGTPVLSKSGVKPVGRLSFARATPVSIGGKLTSATVIQAESDQFNGLIDNPSLDIG